MLCSISEIKEGDQRAVAREATCYAKQGVWPGILMRSKEAGPDRDFMNMVGSPLHAVTIMVTRTRSI